MLRCSGAPALKKGYEAMKFQNGKFIRTLSATFINDRLILTIDGKVYKTRPLLSESEGSRFAPRVFVPRLIHKRG